MVVACLALFVALGGTSIAAVNFARNAGAVDGKSAVASSATLNRAAGKLVATASRGPDKGRIPGKFLADVPTTSTFGRAYDVVDNATGAPTPIGGATGIGTISASCIDENGAAGVEDPKSTISIANSSGEAINVARRIGGGNASVTPQPNGTVTSVEISGSNTFTFHIERRGVNLLVDGVVRQDGRGTNTASCLVYGTVVQVG